MNAVSAGQSGFDAVVHRTSLVDELLREQASLETAVERFSGWHDTAAPPLQERFYKKLIPLSKPRKGEQYAFEVNLDQCTGCKACVAACHSLNGLDEHESWRDTGLLVGSGDTPHTQTVTTACHHCVDPACANGCPVLAYEKDAETGIVRHLDDQCIGCSYCILKCPYDVPKWNPRRGIVRKCDMCQQRLAGGEAPACVQACPSEAISIRIVNKEEVRRRAAIPGERLLPQAFPSDYTKPSTRYISSRAMPPAALFGGGAVRLEEAHWPLAWMLTLTQLAAGIFCCAAALPSAGQTPAALTGAVVLAAGIAISVLHLGQPLRAWRCFLGLRRSWLSREIISFGGFMKAAALSVVLTHPLTLAAAALAGIVGVICSVMVYVDTRRPFWAARKTFPDFLLSTLLLGTAASACVVAWVAPAGGILPPLLLTALAARTGLFVWETTSLVRNLKDPGRADHRSARIMWELKRPVLVMNGLLFAVSLLTGVAACLNIGGYVAWCALGLFLTAFAGRLLARHLFFVAVDAPRMVAPAETPSHSAKS